MQPVCAQEEVPVEAVEAVEAVAVDEDLLEEGTGVVDKGNGRSASQDASSIQWDLSQLRKDGSQAASVHKAQGFG